MITLNYSTDIWQIQIIKFSQQRKKRLRPDLGVILKVKHSYTTPVKGSAAYIKHYWKRTHS